MHDKTVLRCQVLCRIALRYMDVLSSTGFSLCTVDSPQLKPHRLKPVLLDRAGPARSLLAVTPAGNFHRVHVRNTGYMFLRAGLRYTPAVPGTILSAANRKAR